MRFKLNCITVIKMRFYCICVDAFPEISELQQAMAGFQRVELVCAGAFTTATMTSILSGTLGSEIVPGGIGANTSYAPEFLAWRRDGHCLTDVLARAGQQLLVHNHVPWMCRNIVGEPLSPAQLKQHYRDHTAAAAEGQVELCDFGVKTKPNANGVTYSSSHPESTLDTFVEWGHAEKRGQFYANEQRYWQAIRGSFTGLLWTDLCHFHEAVYYPAGNPYHDSSKRLPINKADALRDSVEWLRAMDFTDPDSVYFIYADHSHRVKDYLDPAAFITWGYWRDNRGANAQTLRPVISSCDLYPLILSVLGIKHANPYGYCELPVGLPQPERIYRCEDGRSAAVNKAVATAFARAQKQGDRWLTLCRVLPGAAIPPGLYGSMTLLNTVHSYDLYHWQPGDTLAEFSQVRCEGPLAEIRVERRGVTAIPVALTALEL